jgi:MerR family regulatory protein
MAKTFSIGALARRTGTKIETIRYYERIGLLPPLPARRATIASMRCAISSDSASFAVRVISASRLMRCARCCGLLTTVRSPAPKWTTSPDIT